MESTQQQKKQLDKKISQLLSSPIFKNNSLKPFYYKENLNQENSCRPWDIQVFFFFKKKRNIKKYTKGLFYSIK